MIKRQNLTIKVIVSTMLVSNVANFCYGAIIPFIFDFSYDKYIEFLVKVIILSLMISPLATLIVYSIYRPIKNVLGEIAKGQTPETEKIEKARKSFIIFIRFMFLIGIITYILALVISFGSDALRHVPIEVDTLISRTLAAITWGAIGGFMLVRILNIILIEAKVRINIDSFGNTEGKRAVKERYMTHFEHIALPVLTLLLFLVTFSLIIFYNNSKSILGKHDSSIISMIETYKNTLLKENDVELMKKEIAKISEEYRYLQLQKTIVAVGLIFMLVIIFLSIFLGEIQKHVKNLKLQVDDLSKGGMDLTKKISIVTFDDIGYITHGINGILSNLLKTFKGFSRFASNVFLASKTIEEKTGQSRNDVSIATESIREMNTGTDTQVHIINGVSDNLHTLQQKIETIIGRIIFHTQTVEKTSEDLKSTMNAFNQIIATSLKLNDYYTGLHKAVRAGSDEIENAFKANKEINATSRKVAEIIQIILQLADKSHILSLNASIEAAHAGKHGKGFAIVAEEIRKFSLTTSQMVYQIDTLLKEMEAQNKKGNTINENLIHIFKSITSSIDATGKMIFEVSSLSQEQSDVAQTNKQSLDEMLLIAVSLSNDTKEMKVNNTLIESFISDLKFSSEDLVNMKNKIQEKMISLFQSLDELNSSYNLSLSDIGKLMTLIESYKIES